MTLSHSTLYRNPPWKIIAWFLFKCLYAKYFILSMMEELQDDINVLSNRKFETFKTDDCTGCPNKHGTINNKHGTGRRATRGGKGGKAPPSLIKGGHAPPLRNLAPPPCRDGN